MYSDLTVGPLPNSNNSCRGRLRKVYRCKSPCFQLGGVGVGPELSRTHSLARSVQNDIAGCSGGVGQINFMALMAWSGSHKNLARGMARLCIVSCFLIVGEVVVTHEAHALGEGSVLATFAAIRRLALVGAFGR